MISDELKAQSAKLPAQKELVGYELDLKRYRYTGLILIWLISILLFDLAISRTEAQTSEPPTRERIERYSRQHYLEAIEAIKKNPNDAFANYDLARAFQEMGKCHQAIPYYTKCILSKSDFADAYFFRAQIYGMIGRQKKAIADYTTLIKLLPTDPYPYLYRGLCYSDLGRYEQAIEDYSASIKIEKTSSAYMSRADAYEKLGKLELAEEDKKVKDTLPAHGTITPLDQGADLVTDKLEAQTAKGPTKKEMKLYLEEQARQNKQEILEATKAVKKNPKDALAYYSLAQALRGQRKNHQAIINYTKCILLKPDYSDAYFNRAQLYELSNRRTKAIADYTVLIALNPTDPSYYYWRGFCFDKAGQYETAVDDYTASINIAETNTTYMVRSWAYEKLGKHDLAEEDAKKVATPRDRGILLFTK